MAPLVLITCDVVGVGLQVAGHILRGERLFMVGTQTIQAEREIGNRTLATRIAEMRDFWEGRIQNIHTQNPLLVNY